MQFWSWRSKAVKWSLPFRTQPEPLFAEESEEDEEAEKEPEWKKRKIWGASTAAHPVHAIAEGVGWMNSTTGPQDQPQKLHSSII